MYGVHHGNENGDMTISSKCCQLRVSFESFDPTFEVTENGGVIHVPQEETMVLQQFRADGPTSRQTVATEEKSLFKTKPVATTTTTTTVHVAWQAKKINK